VPSVETSCRTTQRLTRIRRRSWLIIPIIFTLVADADRVVAGADAGKSKVETCVKGQNNGGVYAFAVPRRDPVSEDGMEMAPAGPMGVAQAINFQPTGGGKAAITGDFVLTGNEVNPVIKALLENGIEVTAVHSHMLDEQPRLFFLHFWANNDALKLAKGLRAALDKTASTKS